MLMVYSCITENTQRRLFGSSFPICACHLSLAGRTHNYEPFRHFGKCVLVIKCGQPWAWSIFCAVASSREASSSHLLLAAHRSMAKYRGLVPLPKGWCCEEHGGSQYADSSTLCSYLWLRWAPGWADSWCIWQLSADFLFQTLPVNQCFLSSQPQCGGRESMHTLVLLAMGPSANSPKQGTGLWSAEFSTCQQGPSTREISK